MPNLFWFECHFLPGSKLSFSGSSLSLKFGFVKELAYVGPNFPEQFWAFIAGSGYSKFDFYLEQRSSGS